MPMRHSGEDGAWYAVGSNTPQLPLCRPTPSKRHGAGQFCLCTVPLDAGRAHQHLPHAMEVGASIHFPLAYAQGSTWPTPHIPSTQRKPPPAAAPAAALPQPLPSPPSTPACAPPGPCVAAVAWAACCPSSSALPAAAAAAAAAVAAHAAGRAALDQGGSRDVLSQELVEGAFSKAHGVHESRRARDFSGVCNTLHAILSWAAVRNNLNKIRQLTRAWGFSASWPGGGLAACNGTRGSGAVMLCSSKGL